MFVHVFFVKTEKTFSGFHVTHKLAITELLFGNLNILTNIHFLHFIKSLKVFENQEFTFQHF